MTRGQPAAAVRKAIGRPASRTRPERWGADGEWHSDWNYPARGVMLGMSAATKKGAPTLFFIAIKAPCDWKTAAGIGVGSTKADVDRAYPPAVRDPNVTGDDTIVVGSIFDGLMIDFADGRVTGITAGQFAE